MKYTSLIALLALGMAVMACKAKKIPHEEADNAAIDILAALDSSMAAEETNTIPTASKDSLLASVERTPCFGMCPIYTMHIYQSGFVRYEGKNFVDNIGLYYTYSDASVLEQIKAKAEEIKFFSFDDTYDGQVTDLPTTYVTVNMNGEKKRIKLRYNYPDELKAFGKYLDELYKKVKWEKLVEPVEDK
jgi:hypothetical protein